MVEARWEPAFENLSVVRLQHIKDLLENQFHQASQDASVAQFIGFLVLKAVKKSMEMIKDIQSAYPREANRLLAKLEKTCSEMIECYPSVLMLSPGEWIVSASCVTTEQSPQAA